ncbi:hypothetical protein [Mucilaginibacter sp. SJ]|uniref:hypothetical protein n=1 Tax=Mucilaginibacter sp. SJ TaxID=3029053 RepID=UPI0023A9DF6B|nr:hypothetical protein [Mucilaginibacter sp. SJ]WDZ98702.1 hypothetical protein MusilaSJ_14600 [Mucilaginibacter sp. SJ]
MNPTKLAAFDYAVYQLTRWYSEQVREWRQGNDLSRLKLTKLLFFTVAVTSSPNDAGLLTVFDDFAALPYGHVESDIQNHMNESQCYTITRDQLSFKEGFNNYHGSIQLDENIIHMIDDGINRLKNENPDLINYSAFQLVDLSHKWQSWKTVFSLAKKNGKFSMSIPATMIMNETKIFKL